MATRAMQDAAPKIPDAAAAIVSLLNSRPHATPTLPDTLDYPAKSSAFLRPCAQPRDIPAPPQRPEPKPTLAVVRGVRQQGKCRSLPRAERRPRADRVRPTPVFCDPVRQVGAAASMGFGTERAHRAAPMTGFPAGLWEPDVGTAH